MSGKDRNNADQMVKAKRHYRRFNTRHREDAEIQRLTKLASEIPRYALRYILFRQNRRQKAKQATADAGKQDGQQKQEHSVFAATSFAELPISRRTLDGLACAGFRDLTPIQRLAVPQALAGRDVLAAAPTGSGKTLSFLVPLLEVLWQDKWSTEDGLAAIVLSPTRELAMQTFDVFRKVATFHTISAGLISGGKDIEAEKLKVGSMNVLIATPGRLLHHMDMVAELDCTSLKMLVLDEADRILDMGFAKALDAIIQNLPKERQTLLFSATQTKDVRSLARLSLKDPEYVSASGGGAKANSDAQDGDAQNTEEDKAENGNQKTKFVGVPEGLIQSYVVLQTHEKLSVLWSFIKTHLNSKMIIFFSSTKQVRFAFEAFCKLKPGMSLLHLHGSMKQQRRADMYELFCRTRRAALFCTDVASRGLDFPQVEWVVQTDCPEDVETYVHRVGRTARLSNTGRAILFVTAGKQEHFVELLNSNGINPKKSQVNSDRLSAIDSRIASHVASSVDLRHLAQKAFVMYVNSIHQQSNKDVFDVSEIDFAALAKSFGLSVAPKVVINTEAKGGKKGRAKAKTIYGYDRREDPKQSDANGKDGEEKTSGKKRTIEQEDSESDDEILTLKVVREGPEAAEETQEAADAVSTEAPRKRRRKERKLDLFKNLPSANRIVYDDDGVPMDNASQREGDGDGAAVEQFDDIADYAATVSRRLGESKDEDKLQEQGRVRALHLKRKLKSKGGRKDDGAEESDDDVGSGESSDDNEDVSDEESAPAANIEDESSLALEILSSRR